MIRYISDHLEILVSYSKKSLKWNRVEGCYLQHGCYWWLGACLATGYLQQPWWEIVLCKWLLVNILSSVLLTNFSSPSSLCVCAETANRIQVNFGGDARGLINFRPRSAELPPLLSHGCPIIGWAAPMHFYTNCSDWAQIWWKNPRWDSPCLSGPGSPDQSVHPCSYPFRQKGVFFQWETQILEIKKRGLVFIFKFWKIEFPQFNYPMWWYDDMTYIYK